MPRRTPRGARPKSFLAIALWLTGEQMKLVEPGNRFSAMIDGACEYVSEYEDGAVAATRYIRDTTEEVASIYREARRRNEANPPRELTENEIRELAIKAYIPKQLRQMKKKWENSPLRKLWK